MSNQNHKRWILLMIWRLLDGVGGVGRYCDRVCFVKETKGHSMYYLLSSFA